MGWHWFRYWLLKTSWWYDDGNIVKKVQQIDRETSGQTDGLSHSQSCLVAAKNLLEFLHQLLKLFHTSQHAYQQIDVWGHFSASDLTLCTRKGLLQLIFNQGRDSWSRNDGEIWNSSKKNNKEQHKNENFCTFCFVFLVDFCIFCFYLPRLLRPYMKCQYQEYVADSTKLASVYVSNKGFWYKS